MEVLPELWKANDSVNPSMKPGQALKVLQNVESYSEAEIRDAKIVVKHILRKEIPRETIRCKGSNFDSDFTSETCPTCMQLLMAYGKMVINVKPPRCWNCGQRLIWFNWESLDV